MKCCLVTLADPRKKGAGEIERYFLSLTKVLRQRGDDVTVLMTEKSSSKAPASDDSGTTWTQLPSDPKVRIHPPSLEVPWHVYRWLKERDFDFIQFQDWLGLGFCAFQAKLTGQSFDQTHLSLYFAKPQERTLQTENRYRDSGDYFLRDHFQEQFCAQHADSLVSPNEALFSWAEAEDWILASRRFPSTFPNEFFDHLMVGSPVRRSRDPIENITPKISVCVAYYNQAETLAETLTSLAAQTHPNFEVIVVDDGSTTDEARKVFATEKEKHASRGWYFLPQENVGPGGARNFAARRATGDYLVFFDSDDLASPLLLGSLAKALSQTGLHAVSVGLKSQWTEDPTHDDLVLFLGPALDISLLENCLGSIVFGIEKNLFLKLGGFHQDRNRESKEDWQFFLRLINAGFHLASIPEPLFTYRLHDRGRNLQIDGYQNYLHTVESVLTSCTPWQRQLILYSHLRWKEFPKRSELLSCREEHFRLREKTRWLGIPRLLKYLRLR